MSNADCSTCQKDVVVFTQEYTNFPNAKDPNPKRYRDTICSYCGTVLSRVEVAEQSA